VDFIEQTLTSQAQIKKSGIILKNTPKTLNKDVSGVF